LAPPTPSVDTASSAPAISAVLTLAAAVTAHAIRFAGMVLEVQRSHERQRLRVPHSLASARVSAVRSRGLSALRHPDGVGGVLSVLRRFVARRAGRPANHAVRAAVGPGPSGAP